MPVSQLMALRERRADLLDEASTLLAAAEAEDRDLNDEEQSRYEAISAEVGGLDNRIQRHEAMADQERNAVPVSSHRAGQDHGDTRVSARDRIDDDPQRGFASFGEYALAVREAAIAGGHVDDRLRIGAAPTSYGNEGSGSDGGYLIPPEFSRNVYQHSLEEDALLPMTDNDPITGNSMVYPKDETTPWGSNGIRAYWEGEASQGNQSKPVVGSSTLRLRKLFALVPVTDELLSDATALDSYINRKAGESVRWKTNDAIVNGDGAGKPMGIMNAGCLVTQAKKTSQTADTIVAENIVKMFARNTSPARAEWLINPDAYPQLPLLTLGDQPMYVGPNGMADAPLGTLLGRPVRMTDTCQTVGDLGDIIFADMKGYKTITKSGGIQTDTSMHLWFDYDVMAFRVIFRVDGQPWLSDAITPPNSSVTRSPFVTLAARA